MTKLRNSIQKFFVAKEQRQIVERAKQRFSYKPFYQEYQNLHITSNYGRVLMHLFSIVTGLTFLALLINSAIQYGFLSLLISGLLLIIWEIGKTNILSSLFTSYYQRGRVPVGLSLLGLCFLFGSVFCSVEGAKKFYELNDKSVENFEVSNKAQVDSINQHYSTQIAAIHTQIYDIEKHKSKRWGGLLSQSENQQILNYQEDIKSLKSEKNTNLLQLTTEQKQQLSEIQETSTFNVLGFLALALINESLILLVGWFLVFYDYKTATESEQITENEKLTFDFPTLQQLVELVQMHTASNQTNLSASLSPLNGNHSASAVTEYSNGILKNQETEAASATNDLAKDIKRGVRDFRYLMRKHKVNVLTVKAAIDRFEKTHNSLHLNSEAHD